MTTRIGMTIHKKGEVKTPEVVILDVDINNMNVDELKAYAEMKGIDIGMSTSQKGILAKIKAVQG